MMETKKERIVRFLDRKLSVREIAKLVPCTEHYVRATRTMLRRAGKEDKRRAA